MKTRNNQSNADETLLNQNITRRSFVKRTAAASAATVFGGALIRSTNAFGDGFGPQQTSLGDYCVYPGENVDGIATSEADLAEQVYSACFDRTPWPPEEWLPGYQSVHPKFEITNVIGNFHRETMPNGNIAFTLRPGNAFQIRHSEILDIP